MIVCFSVIRLLVVSVIGDRQAAHNSDLLCLCLDYYSGEFVAPFYYYFRGGKCTLYVSSIFLKYNICK